VEYLLKILFQQPWFNQLTPSKDGGTCKKNKLREKKKMHNLIIEYDEKKFEIPL
jgi:hypothetical protein